MEFMYYTSCSTQQANGIFLVIFIYFMDKFVVTINTDDKHGTAAPAAMGRDLLTNCAHMGP